MKDLSIFPIPQSIKMEQGSCPVNTPVSYECDDKLKKEEYEIVVSKEKITIRFSSEEGKFRANTT